jgi:hypothetical protein
MYDFMWKAMAHLAIEVQNYTCVEMGLCRNTISFIIKSSLSCMEDSINIKFAIFIPHEVQLA